MFCLISDRKILENTLIMQNEVVYFFIPLNKHLLLTLVNLVCEYVRFSRLYHNINVSYP